MPCEGSPGVGLSPQGPALHWVASPAASHRGVPLGEVGEVAALCIDSSKHRPQWGAGANSDS